jgi:glycosyltransferase involved in cell wall biosynthesis
MKILIISDNLPDQVNGVVTTYKNLEIYAVSAGYSIVHINPRQFNYIDCPNYPEVKLSWPKQIGQKIEEMDANHIHIATEGPIGLAAKIYCDYKGYAYTTAYHTKFPEFLNKIAFVPKGITYKFLRWFHKKAKAVLVPSQSVKDELEQKGFKNLVVWTRGVSKDIILPKQSGRKSQPLKVLSVGRVSREKGLDDLCKLEDDYDITIVGDGPYLNDLKRKYKKVNFVGYKFGKELAKYYSENDVFCFTSQTDTFGIVIIEALCNGLPVAAYRVTGPQDIVEYGVTGYMCMPGNKLSSVIEKCKSLDNVEVQNLSIKKWTWKNCFEIFIKSIK